MKIVAKVKVWTDGQGYQETEIEISEESLANIVREEAIERYDGLSAEVVDMELKLTF